MIKSQDVPRLHRPVLVLGDANGKNSPEVSLPESLLQSYLHRAREALMGRKGSREG